MVFMKQRTISAIILLTLMIGCFILHSKLFGLLMGILAIIGFNEIFNIKFKSKSKRVIIIKLLGIIMMSLLLFNNVFYNLNIESLILIPLLGLSLPIIFYNDSDVYNINDYLYVLGIVYLIGFSFGNIIFLRDSDIGRCIFIFIIAFITDTYAYIGGSLIGRHKLTTISPKKTIEGVVIGTIMGTLIGSVYYYNVIGGNNIFIVIVLCLFLTLSSEIGDLMFSSIKRFFDKKDYSNLIPGHGGVLDRFDSVIYVSLGLLLIMSIL